MAVKSASMESLSEVDGRVVEVPKFDDGAVGDTVGWNEQAG